MVNANAASANHQRTNALVEQLIKEEIYYQEAISQGLDIEDTIVRRRMVQKLTFLTEDVSVPEDPSIETLQRFYEDNLQRYQEPTRFSFSHRYFSLDKRDDAEADARSATENAEFRDDPFMLQKNMSGSLSKRSETYLAATSLLNYPDFQSASFGKALCNQLTAGTRIDLSSEAERSKTV